MLKGRFRTTNCGSESSFTQGPINQEPDIRLTEEKRFQYSCEFGLILKFRTKRKCGSLADRSSYRDNDSTERSWLRICPAFCGRVCCKVSIALFRSLNILHVTLLKFHSMLATSQLLLEA
ncbi:conserved hypothetical protein [Trichinella spiralis]|uniref:hypothetical protein n=1 Tax=Trichinella spiralis TaxID=6334 RepID=UPI0001EFCB74|nr:conserved hypothetical protein [Trichinella spiralis]